MNRLIAIVNRVMLAIASVFLHLAGARVQEQPHTGRVCVKCHEPIGKHDKYKQLVVAHDNCRDPQGLNRTEPLDTLLDRGVL